MEAGDKQDMAIALRAFKTETGMVNFQAVLSIPRAERIPEMAKNDLKRTIALISVGLTGAFENMNLKRGMTGPQILDLAETVVDTSAEDNLSFEDLMLFLQKLVRGEYGANYDSMDIPKFMEKFEQYREDRWQQLLAIRDNAHIETKMAGNTEKTNQRDPLSEHFASLGDRLSDLKDRLKQTKEENKNLKMDKF